MADFYKTPTGIVKRNAAVLGATVLATFFILRVALSLSPNSDFNVGGYNVHHLFTGLLFIVMGGIPLAIFRGFTRRLDVALVVFGVGLGMALDEWVYLIATDGSNASYLLPVSFWGGVILTGLALIYVIVLVAWRIREGQARGNPMPTAD